MKIRYFSHYIYIEPDILLKNYVVEVDDKHHIVEVFPFEKEIERTEFYSGILLFIEEKTALSTISLEKIKDLSLVHKEITLKVECKYKMFHFEDFVK